MPIFWANSDYNRGWTRCLYARFPNAVITKINRHYPDGWIKVWYKNDKRYWKGKLQTDKQKNEGVMKRQTTKPLTSVEWDTCWMAIRYAMGAQTIASASLPRKLLSAYYDRWTDAQKGTIVRDLRDHYDDFGCFGNKNIDHPDWMRFMLTLDPKAHCTVTASDGIMTEKVECVEYDGKYYPISGSHRYWDGVGDLTVAGEYVTNVEKIL